MHILKGSDSVSRERETENERKKGKLLGFINYQVIILSLKTSKELFYNSWRSSLS